MPASISFNGFRLDDAEAIGGWVNIGGGQSGSAEGSFPYQGANLFNRKVTGNTGFAYDPTADGKSAQNMTVTNKVWLAKIIVTDYGGLNTTDGVALRIGSSSNAYYRIIIAGSACPVNAYKAYPPRGGLLIVPVDPNIAGYRNATQGSPNLASASYFGTVANFVSSTAKSENVGCDAIDLAESLLVENCLSATLDDIYDFDEGDTNNRYGIFTKANETFLLLGKLAFQRGTLGTAKSFDDQGKKVIIGDGLVDSGYFGISVDTDIDGDSYVFSGEYQSLGTDTVVDTRADFAVTNALSNGVGSVSITGKLINFRNVNLINLVTVSDGAVIQCKNLTQGGASITNSIIECIQTANNAVVANPDLTLLTDCDFRQEGTGHAIEITQTGTFTLDNLNFTGFGGTAGSNLTPNSGASDAVIYNNSGGAVTLNISGGNVPSIRNGAGATTTAELSIAWTFEVVDEDGNPVQDAEVTVTDGAGNPAELYNLENTPVNGTAVYSFDGALSGTGATILVLKSGVGAKEPFSLDTLHPSSATTTKIQLSNDRTESNPT